jgi:predicted esterase
MRLAKEDKSNPAIRLFVSFDHGIVRPVTEDARQPTENTIETLTHGRYLVHPAPEPNSPVLMGFHGYGETAEEELYRLRRIPGIEHWNVVSVEALHRFYRRRFTEVGASWMTRENRELTIADNIRYVSSVVTKVMSDHRPGTPLVMTGFSQGVAMAFRAAATVSRRVSGVIACGGDVPPELEASQLARIPSVLIGHGSRDEWYTAEKVRSDEQRLRAARIGVQIHTSDAGHEWTPEFSEKCSQFLENILATESRSL